MMKYENKHYSDLSEKQLNSLTEFELIEKFLYDDSNRVEKYFGLCLLYKRHIIGTSVLGFSMLFVLGFWALLSIIPLLIFIKLFYVNKDKLTWCMRSFKLTVGMFRGNGNFLQSVDYLFERYCSKLDHINIGKHYDRLGSE